MTMLRVWAAAMMHSAQGAVRMHRAWLRGATPRPRSGMPAERSYPASEVRGSDLECRAVTAQELPRGATPRQRSVAAGRRQPRSEVRAAAAERSDPRSKEQWLSGRWGA